MNPIRTKVLARVAGAIAFALVAASCSDRTIFSPNPALQSPEGSTHIVAPIGTFSWLAPLGGGAANPATFDATGATRVEVCVWTGGACSGALTASFTTAANTLTANTTAGRFEATWNLLSTTFITRRTYRIRAFNGTTEIGAVSVDVVRGRWALTRTDGTLAPLIAANELPIQFHVATVPLPAVVFNEVESNGGTPGDWAELYNKGTSTVDLSGYVFKDGDDSHNYVLPSGSTIAPGGYLVLEEAAFGFGLGAPESVRLFTPWGVVVDSYSWSTHATTTYGRCPNATGAFITMATSTKGAANDCSVAVKINEVESNGGTPGDWVELYNPGTTAVDLSGFIFKDSDDSHAYAIPQGTTIAAGAYLVLNEADFVFGLGAPDAARLFAPNGSVVDSYSWTSHAATTYGRCVNGTGSFITTTSSTKGAANDCSSPSDVKINEVESNNGTPGDWIELYNAGSSAVNIGGFVLKDNDDTHTYTIPVGTTIASHAFLVFDEATFVFGLGAADAARLFAPGGVTLLDSYTWTAHASTTYGRCPDGTGAFVTTTAPTKGGANCGTELWPGSDDVTTVDGSNVFGSNLSGLIYEAGATDVLWAAKNGIGSIYRLIFSGGIWTPDPTNGWATGKPVKYMDGLGEPDAEDLTFTTGSAAGMYVATERNNQNNGVSRPAILRYDVTGTGATLTATNEWNLTADLPVLGANLGLEAITWIPDAALVSQGFFDVTAGHLYNPAEYANHGGGLFFVGVEGNGFIYAYALNHTTNGFTRIASLSTGFPAGVMALRYDPELTQLWATCDDSCGGLSNIYVIDVTPGSPTPGRLKLTHTFARPTTMPNINNEGFAFGPQSSCVAGKKPVFWSDDSETGGHSIRKATIPCVKFP
jgi:hypothetical protein